MASRVLACAAALLFSASVLRAQWPGRDDDDQRPRPWRDRRDFRPDERYGPDGYPGPYGYPPAPSYQYPPPQPEGFQPPEPQDSSDQPPPAYDYAPPQPESFQPPPPPAGPPPSHTGTIEWTDGSPSQAPAQDAARTIRQPDSDADSSSVDIPTYSDSQNPHDYALVVGIEKYASLPEAQFALHDAKAMYAHLLAMGYPARNVVLLTGDDASRASIVKDMTWLSNHARKDSTVFFYYSGHGAPDPTTGEAYLVPFDGDPQYLRDTGYPVKTLYAKLAALKAKRVFVALDSCFSGAGGRSVLAKGIRPLVTKIDMGYAPGGRVIALSASAGNQISGVDDAQSHGLFTYYLLKGLNGAAQDKDGHVSVQALYDYLTPKVEDAARRDNRSQSPQLMPADARALLR